MPVPRVTMEAVASLEPMKTSLDKAKIKISANSYESKVTFDERKHTGKYAEFFCQICLEQMEPKTYIPLRRKIPSYAAKMKAHFPVAPKQTVVWR